MNGNLILKTLFSNRKYSKGFNKHTVINETDVTLFLNIYTFHFFQNILLLFILMDNRRYSNGVNRLWYKYVYCIKDT